MLIAAIVSWAYDDGVTLNMLLAGISTLIIGVTMMFITREHDKELNKRDGYIVVAIGWAEASKSMAAPPLPSRT